MIIFKIFDCNQILDEMSKKKNLKKEPQKIVV